MSDKGLLSALSPRLRRDLERICNRTGRKPTELVREIVTLYGPEETKRSVKLNVKELPKEFCDAVLAVASSIRGHRTASVLSKEEKIARATKGGIAKAKKAKERAEQQKAPSSNDRPITR